MVCMIGKIKGILSTVEGNTCLIETASGVSYELYITPRLISRTAPGSVIEAYTHLQVRDDAFVLFGFESQDEHHFFKLLLTVPGVGPKTAFGIVSQTAIGDLLTAVRSNDVSFFTSIPGLGKKTALKIILELSQKIKSEFKFDQKGMSDDDRTVIEALVALGFKHQDAKKLFSKLPEDLTVEEKIRFALKKTVSP